MMPGSVTVVVPLFNKERFVRQSLTSIVAAARAAGDVEVLVVDNGSTDASFELAAAFVPAVRVHRFLGSTISSVRNWGTRQGRGEIVSFLDADVTVAPEYFVRLRQVFQDTGAAATGCECDVPTPGRWIERTWHRLNVRTTDGDRHYINSANFAMRREAFDAVGGFPEELATSEDYEICRRLVAAGRRVYQSTAVAAIHLDNPGSLRAFAAKTYWHGLGAVRASGGGSLNRPTMMAMAHLLMLVLAGTSVAVGAWRVAALALWLVPGVTYTFRVGQVRRFVNPLPALLLLQVFFLGRGAALVAAATGRSGARGQVAPK